MEQRIKDLLKELNAEIYEYNNFIGVDIKINNIDETIIKIKKDETIIKIHHFNIDNDTDKTKEEFIIKLLELNLLLLHNKKEAIEIIKNLVE